MDKKRVLHVLRSNVYSEAENAVINVLEETKNIK
jgi:hypothetical protein